MTNYTKLARDLRDCLQRAGAPLSEDQFMLIAGYLAQYQHHTDENLVNRLKLDLVQSAAEMQEMARCLNENLNDIDEAIRATMRSGNGGKLWVDGKELSTHQVADRLENLMIKRDRIRKTLKPLKVEDLKQPGILQEYCTYPTCHCPFDRGTEFFCLRGLPEEPAPTKS